MSDHVTITRQPGAANASFETIGVTQSQMVFWKNEDTQPHWPIFTGGSQPALPYQVGPKGNSDSLQPSLGNAASADPSVVPQGQSVTVTYGCKLHSGESGTINVCADFYSQPNQLPGASQGKAYAANLTTGGMPPYTPHVSNSNLPPSLTVKNVTGQGPVVSGIPGSGDTGSFAFDLYCEDSLGNNVTQTYLLTVS
jgi:hypothetical protein